MDVVREGENIKGWLLGLVLKTIGKGVLKTAFTNSAKAIEVRNGVRKGHALHEEAIVRG